MNSVKNFKDNGYLIIPKILSGELLDFIGIYAYNRAKLQFTNLREPDPQTPNTPAFYADMVMENLSDFLLSKIESAAGMKLLPTYTYFRVYKAGDILENHRDRPSCEISISLSLRKKGNIWPIYINNTAVMLEEGDAVLYRGCEVEHWREPYTEGTKQAQVFLHYVDANGRFTEWENDKLEGKFFAQEK